MVYEPFSRGKMALYKLAHEAASERQSNDYGGNVFLYEREGNSGVSKGGRLLMMLINNVKQYI